MKSADYEGTLLFMTDPICSWCWGTLPEVMKLKSALGQRLEFKLRCAGLQVGSMKPLTEHHINDLVRLWRGVAETTGQEFAYSPPGRQDLHLSQRTCLPYPADQPNTPGSGTLGGIPRYATCLLRGLPEPGGS